MTKEVGTDTASGGVWNHRTSRQVSSTGVTRSTPVSIGNSIGIAENYSLVLIGIIETAPHCDLNLSQEVGNKWQSTSPGLVRKSKKLDAVVDRKLPNNPDSASIFSKVIGDKLSDGSSRDLYTRCRMNLTSDPIQTKTPQFINLGISTIDALDKGSGISTPCYQNLKAYGWCPLDRT